MPLFCGSNDNPKSIVTRRSYLYRKYEQKNPVL